MWQFEPISLQGAFLIELPKFFDDRGSFIKTFQQSVFAAQGIDFELKESYFSISKKDVIRGMHFQLPPHDHSKIVFCPQGRILDVLLDIRKDAPTYGQFFCQELSADNHKALYIPKGFAHGFKSLTDDAMTYYLVSSEHHGPSDAGIHFDSFGMDWQVESPIMSERDKGFSHLNAFASPF